MSMWKTIPTLFGDLADRPDAADVPYGTGWVDEDDNLSISDGTVWTDVAGGGAVAVEDDGTPVIAAASTLNFGDNLSVTDDGGGQVTIDATGGGGGGGAAYCETVGDDSETSFDIVHDLDSTCVVVSAAEVTSGDGLVHGTDFTWLVVDADTVRVVFTAAPDTDDAEITVLASGGTSGGGTPLVTGTVQTADSNRSTSGWSWKGNTIEPIIAFDLARVGIWMDFVSGGTYQGAVVTRASGQVDAVWKTAPVTVGRAGWGLVWVAFPAPVPLAVGTQYGILLGRTDAGNGHALPTSYPPGLQALEIPAVHVDSWRVNQADLQPGQTINTFTGTIGQGWAISA